MQGNTCKSHKPTSSRLSDCRLLSRKRSLGATYLCDLRSAWLRIAEPHTARLQAARARSGAEATPEGEDVTRGKPELSEGNGVTKARPS